MGIVVWVLVGGALGFLVNVVFDRASVAANIAAGVAGAALAGWIATLFGAGAWNAFSLVNLLIAAAGSCLALVGAYKLLDKRP